VDACIDRRRAGRHRDLRQLGGADTGQAGTGAAQGPGWLNRRDDEQFWEQAAAVCEVYLRPPPGTVVICIDEKTGIQARHRRYPEQPARPGRLARREFEYVRNGTVSIIAALEAATGQVITEPITRNDSAAFTGFLHRLDQCTDPRLTIHLVMDNGSSHTSRATRAWIAAHPGSPSPTRPSMHRGWTWPSCGSPP
jgi:DDE superfamily endonuclease